MTPTQPFGDLVDVGGRRLHVIDAGNGSPAVVFENGTASTSMDWRAVQPAISEVTRTVAYDRAGYA